MMKLTPLPLLGVALPVVASWIHYTVTGSLRVDENYLQGLPMWVSLVLSWGGILALTWWASRPLRAIFDSNRIQSLTGAWPDMATLRHTGIAAVLLATFMLPLLSNDIFSLLAYGDLSHKGVNPYTPGVDLSVSDYYSYIGPKYKNTPCVYGPLNLHIATVAASLAQGNVWIGMLVIKLITAVFGIFAIMLLTAEESPWVDGPALPMIILGPITLLEGIGQNHNDVFGFVMLISGIYALFRERFTWSLIALGIAVLLKLSFVFVLPLPVLYIFYHYYLQQRDLRYSIQKTLTPVGIAFFAGFLITLFAYWPWLNDMSAFAAPFSELGKLRPSGTFSDVIGGIYAMIIQATGHAGTPELTVDSNTMNALQEPAWAILVPLFKLVGLALAGIALYDLRKVQQPRDLYPIFMVLTVAMLCVFSHRYLPWYALVFLPLFTTETPRQWIRWALALGVVSVWQDTTQIAPAGSVVAVVNITASTLATLGVFGWAMVMIVKGVGARSQG